MSANGAYDLPTLIDLALKTNPQTRSACYAALKANAQLGQSEASDYPKIQANVDSAYFKLPIQFPEQTLIVRNEAFLPQIKVSYDLPLRQESIQKPLASRFCPIALCLARIESGLV